MIYALLDLRAAGLLGLEKPFEVSRGALLLALVQK
jgi:hypothetical protein